MKKFCIALALSFLSSQSVSAGDVSLGISFTKTFTNTSQQNTIAPSWVNEVEFERDGVRYFVGESSWTEHENIALNQAKAQALGAMSFAKESIVNTWYEEEISHNGQSGTMQSSKRTTANFNHARSNTVLTNWSVAGVHTEIDEGFFKTKYKKFVLIKANKKSDILQTGAPGGLNYYKDIGKTWTDPQTGIVFVPIPETTMWMSQSEITIGQYSKFMDTSHFLPKYNRSNYPAHNMKLKDVKSYISKVREFTGLQVRLPTKEEWQWACQSGRNFDEVGNNNGYIIKARHNNPLHPVDRFDANTFNLYGMSSGVMEYLDDSHFPGYTPKAGGSDKRVQHVKCNKISVRTSDFGEKHVGFRLVIE